MAASAEWIRTHTPESGNYYRQKQDYGVMGTLGGHELQVRNAADDSRLGSYPDLAVSLKGVPVPPLVFTRTELLEGSAGILTRLKNKVAGLPDYQAQLLKTVADKKAVLTEVESQQGKPFKYEAKLVQAKVTCAELDGKLKASIELAKQAQPETPETADALNPALA